MITLDFLTVVESLNESLPLLGFTKPMILALSHKTIPADDVLIQIVGDEAVLLSLASEQYFSLDPVGTKIWLLLSQDSSLQPGFRS